MPTLVAQRPLIDRIDRRWRGIRRGNQQLVRALRLQAIAIGRFDDESVHADGQRISDQQPSRIECHLLGQGAFFQDPVDIR
jgi:hypothetical protein